MADLTAEEQAVWDKLVAKVNTPVVKKAFEDVGDVLKYLVAQSDKFTANPEDRQVALDVIEAAFPKAAPANASE